MEDQETWRPVVGYEAWYEVSDLGRVRSLDRYTRVRHGLRLLRGRILKPGISSTKRTVVLYRDGDTRKTRLVAHLVLEAFTGPRPSGQQARHGPGLALDDRLANLSWGTRQENCADMVRDGTRLLGEQVTGARLTAEIVSECRRRYLAGETQGVLSAEFGVSRPTLSNAITGKTWYWLPGAVLVDRNTRRQRGTAHNNAKLMPEIIAEARHRNAAGESQYALAAEFGVTQATLWKAIRGKTWNT